MKYPNPENVIRLFTKLFKRVKLKKKMSEEASVGTTNIHIGPIIDVNNAGKVENNETINFICCSSLKRHNLSIFNTFLSLNFRFVNITIYLEDNQSYFLLARFLFWILPGPSHQPLL